MKKVILVMLLCLPVVLFAQENKKMSVGLNFGVSIPYGDFADEEEGGADVGSNIGLKGFYRYTDQISFGVSLNANAFEYSDDFKEDMEESLAEGTTLELEKWNFVTFLITPRYYFPLSEKLKIFGELNFGLAFCNSPEIVGKLDCQEVFKYISASSTALIFGIGTGAELPINDKWCLDAGFAMFPVLEPEYEFEDSGVKSKEKSKQNYLRLTLGISYLF